MKSGAVEGDADGGVGDAVGEGLGGGEGVVAAPDGAQATSEISADSSQTVMPTLLITYASLPLRARTMRLWGALGVWLGF